MPQLSVQADRIATLQSTNGHAKPVSNLVGSQLRFMSGVLSEAASNGTQPPPGCGCGRQSELRERSPGPLELGPGSLVFHPIHQHQEQPMGQLGVNAHGEVLEAGRVPDCYLGLLLDPADDGEGAGVLVIAPPALLHPLVPQPDGTLLYELLTGHPDRTPGQLVFLADLTVELRAWPTDTWAKVGVDPQAAAGAVVAGWRDGHLRGLWLGGLTAQEVLALERPAMTYVRAQLGDRLARGIAQTQQHGRPLPNGRRPEGRFL
jgi:hypothetical protein